MVSFQWNTVERNGIIRGHILYFGSRLFDWKWYEWIQKWKWLRLTSSLAYILILSESSQCSVIVRNSGEKIEKHSYTIAHWKKKEEGIIIGESLLFKWTSTFWGVIEPYRLRFLVIFVTRTIITAAWPNDLDLLRYGLSFHWILKARVIINIGL